MLLTRLSSGESRLLHPTSKPLREHFGSRHAKLWIADLAFRPVPPFVAARLRTQALRAAGFEIGHASVFWGRPRFFGTGDIAARLTVGHDCGFNAGCTFDLEHTVTIGNHVSVGHRVMFLSRSYRAGSSKQRAGEVLRAPIVIEDGAWLGAGSLVMPGVTIGAGSVIGAGAAITQDVPANTLVNGAQQISIAKWR